MKSILSCVLLAASPVLANPAPIGPLYPYAEHLMQSSGDGVVRGTGLSDEGIPCTFAVGRLQAYAGSSYPFDAQVLYQDENGRQLEYSDPRDRSITTGVSNPSTTKDLRSGAVEFSVAGTAGDEPGIYEATGNGFIYVRIWNWAKSAYASCRVYARPST